MAIKELSIQGEIVSKNPKRKYLKFAIPAVGFLLLIVVGFIAYVGLVVAPNTKELTASVQGAYEQVQKVQEAIEDEDITKIKDETTKLKEELKISQQDLDNMGFVRYVPIVNGYYNDAKHLIAAGIAGAEAGEIAIDGIAPFADVLGLKGKKSKTTAEEKTEVIVKDVLPILPHLLGELEKKLNLIDKELSQVDPYRYPEGLIIKGFKVRDGLIEAQKGINKAQEAMSDIKILVTVAPEILGQTTEKKYLILFQNDKELRATGGFITSYAIAKIKNGKLISVDSEDIYDLDKRFSSPEPKTDPLRKYILLGYSPIRDTKMSSDYLRYSETL